MSSGYVSEVENMVTLSKRSKGEVTSGVRSHDRREMCQNWEVDEAGFQFGGYGDRKSPVRHINGVQWGCRMLDGF